MKHKLIKILGIVVVVVLVIVAIYYILDNRSIISEDASNFSEEYINVPIDNMFVYKTEKEIIDILKNKTGIVYMGFPECPWCQKYVELLYEVAKEKEIEKIYYCNIKDARQNNTAEYQEIVSILEEYLLKDAANNARVFVPDVTFVLNGEIKWHDNETSVVEEGINPNDYWTIEKKDTFKKNLSNAIDDVFYGICNSCN